MQQFSLVVQTPQEAQAAVDMLWNRLMVRGEVAVVPLDERVKIDVVSEKELTPAQLEQLPGKRS